MAPQIAIISSTRPIPERTYLDHAATTPLRPEAKAAMEEGFRQWANPSSPHAEGRRARALLEDARARIKAALGWEGEVIFTSGASEALAIGLGRAKADRRVASAVEHDAVFRAAPDAEVLPVVTDPESIAWGALDGNALSDALARPGRAVVAVQSINSETGGSPLRVVDYSALSMIRDAGAISVCDCSQSAGKEPLPDADMIVVSAHKLGGPIGAGALLLRDYALLEPSGGQERGYRAGTENLPAILGFVAALETGGTDTWATRVEHRADFKNRLFEGGELIAPGGNCGNIFAAACRELTANAALVRLDAMGFAVSAGSACSSGTLKPSRTLAAYGIDSEVAKRTIRVSLGWSTTPAELAAFADAWRALNEGQA